MSDHMEDVFALAQRTMYSYPRWRIPELRRNGHSESNVESLFKDTLNRIHNAYDDLTALKRQLKFMSKPLTAADARTLFQVFNDTPLLLAYADALDLLMQAQINGNLVVES